MADRAVLTDDRDVVPQLLRMELDRDTLIDVLRVAASERALCTSNDVRGFDLITMNDKVVRGLRDAFCDDRWKKDEKDNQEGIINHRLKLRVIACNFDANTSDCLRDPTNLSPKGSASGKKARCNSTAWLPGLPEIPVQESEDYVTWVLGSYVDADGVLKGELSLPFVFTNKQYGRFDQRIILLSGSEGSAPVQVRAPVDREGPVEIMDISVRRK